MKFCFAATSCGRASRRELCTSVQRRTSRRKTRSWRRTCTTSLQCASSTRSNTSPVRTNMRSCNHAKLRAKRVSLSAAAPVRGCDDCDFLCFRIPGTAYQCGCPDSSTNPENDGCPGGMIVNDCVARSASIFISKYPRFQLEPNRRWQILNCAAAAATGGACAHPTAPCASASTDGRVISVTKVNKTS